MHADFRGPDDLRKDEKPLSWVPGYLPDATHVGRNWPVWQKLMVRMGSDRKSDCDHAKVDSVEIRQAMMAT